MAEQQLTEADGRRALQDHILEIASAARQRCGGAIGRDEIFAVLEDRRVVRYPTLLRFDASGLQSGEFAHAALIADTPADGFVLYVHPALESRDDLLPLAVAYHLVTINYGDIASSAEAELFGATLLGIEVESYYQALCELADQLSA